MWVAGLASIAFHEIMLIKLDVGARVIADLQPRGGGGLAHAEPEQGQSMTLHSALALLEVHGGAERRS